MTFYFFTVVSKRNTRNSILIIIFWISQRRSSRGIKWKPGIIVGRSRIWFPPEPREWTNRQCFLPHLRPSTIGVLTCEYTLLPNPWPKITLEGFMPKYTPQEVYNLLLTASENPKNEEITKIPVCATWFSRDSLQATTSSVFLSMFLKYNLDVRRPFGVLVLIFHVKQP